jgi:hypothetical protein
MSAVTLLPYRPTKRITDKGTLDTIYAIAFETIKELGYRVSEVMRLVTGTDNFFTLYSSITTEKLFVLKPHKLAEIFQYLKEGGLEEFSDDVMDPLWKASLPFVNDSLLQVYQLADQPEERKSLLRVKDEMKLNDWRQVIKSKRYWTENDEFDRYKYGRRKANKQNTL